MIEHSPWIGPDYQQGIEGHRVAIVGYSNWWDSEDSADVTTDTVERVVSGEWKPAFFSSIRNYFGFTSNAEFWNRVMFFNFVPEIIGKGDERFNSATKEQKERGRERVLRLFDEHRPQKAFVFSTKAWTDFPPLNEGIERDWGTYGEADRLVTAFGLRHPQGADGADMKRKVEEFMRMPVLS